MSLTSIRTATALFQVLSFVAGSAANLFPTSNATAQNAARQACNNLKSSLGAPFVQANSTDYEFAATNAWNLQNAEFQPSCIVFPRTSAHVQVAMKAIYDADSHYAVQAGSHSAMKGWNTVQDGVLIIFTNMKNASYDPVRDSITLEPGIHWEEAVTALEPYGVAPVGGKADPRFYDVGTGLLLGGGLSWLSPSQGYAADTFMELDVVLVTGELVTASASNNYSDLFRALKGGGNRFGVVTRYELHAVHTGTKDVKDFYGGMIIYNSSAEALLNATARYIREVQDPKAVLLVSFVNLITDGEIVPIYLVCPFYNGTELPEDIFGDFLSIPAASSQLGPLSYFDVAGTLGLGNDRGYVQHFGASALVGDEDFCKENFNTTTLAFTPIPDSQIQAGRAQGGNIINPPSGSFAAIPPNVKQGIDILFEQIPPSPGLPLYLGECDEFQSVFQSYGDYELLKEVYAKYDPTRFNVNHLQGPGGL
ncbi:hypothetical protein B0H11DRAFT_1970759 [Mycena galericulata]|nr:hypothetical protein B0H11DRAFT_1970759 [Mycena galericulata]